MTENEKKEEQYHQTQMDKKKRSSMRKMSSMDKKHSSKSIQEQQIEIDMQMAGRTSKKPPVKLDRMRVLKLLKNNKCDLALGTFGAFATGALHPVVGLILAMAINALSNPDDDVKRKDGNFYSLMYLLMAVLAGVLLFFKIWKFRTVGSILCNSGKYAN